MTFTRLSTAVTDEPSVVAVPNSIESAASVPLTLDVKLQLCGSLDAHLDNVAYI